MHKKAVMAFLNERRNRIIVDTSYEMIDGKQKLILLLDNGQREIFKGLRAA